MMTTIDDDEIKEGKKKIRVERWRGGGGGGEEGKLQPNGVKEV